MNLSRFSFAALSLLTVAAQAAEPAPADPGKYQLKARSSFASTATARPPFWPIGWVRRQEGVAATAPEAAPKATLDEKSFVVTSILMGSRSFAVINGRSYEEGEFVRLPKSSGGVKVRVQRILDGAVQLQTPVQMLTASLRRPELGLRKVAEQLLNDDQ